MSPHIDEVRFDPRLLAQKRREAVAARGELLLDVSEGRLSAWEAIMSVVLDDRQSLRSLRLDQILMTQEGVGAERARRVVEQILTVLEVPAASADPRTVTVGYLLDGRAAGRRDPGGAPDLRHHRRRRGADRLARIPLRPLSR